MTNTWSRRPLAALDTETTGTDVETDRIVTACVATVNTPSPVEPCQWLINPGVEIPATATAVHGITTEQAQADGVEPRVALERILGALHAQWAAGIPIVAHNASFDLTILDQEVRRHRVADGIGPVGPVIDPLVLDRHLDPYRRGSRKLDAVCAHYRVRLDTAHDSTQDALAAARIAWRILRRHPDLDGMPADDLCALQQKAHAAWAGHYQAYLRKQGKPDATIDPSWPIRHMEATA